MDRAAGHIEIGTRVLVRNRFLEEFRPGFEVAEATGDGYVVKRVYDGERLPASFSVEDLRVEG
jgi:hypothetical protein